MNVQLDYVKGVLYISEIICFTVTNLPEFIQILEICNLCHLLTKVCRGAFRKQDDVRKKSYRYVSYIMCVMLS